ncbi:hypothetical protein [Mycoplasma sp. 4423]
MSLFLFILMCLGVIISTNILVLSFIILFNTNSFTNFIIYKCQKLVSITEARQTNVLFKKGGQLYLKENKFIFKNMIMSLFIIFLLFFINELIVNLDAYNKLASQIKLGYFKEWRYVDIFYAFALVIESVFIVLYYKKYKYLYNKLTKIFDYFEYSEEQYYLNNEQDAKYDDNKFLCHIYYKSNKIFYMNYKVIDTVIIRKSNKLAIYYFLIFGYHFKQINYGNMIYKDLYQAFLYYKNNNKIR